MYRLLQRAGWLILLSVCLSVTSAFGQAAWQEHFDDGTWPANWQSAINTQTAVTSPVHSAPTAIKFRGVDGNCHTTMYRKNFSASTGYYSAWVNQQHREAGFAIFIQVQPGTNANPFLRDGYGLSFQAANAQAPGGMWFSRYKSVGSSYLIANKSVTFNMNEWVQVFIRRFDGNSFAVGYEINGVRDSILCVDPNPPLATTGAFYLWSCSDGPATDNFFDDVAYEPIVTPSIAYKLLLNETDLVAKSGQLVRFLGRVVDQNNNPVPAYRLRYYDPFVSAGTKSTPPIKETTTDINGNFVAEFMAMRQGLYATEFSLNQPNGIDRYRNTGLVDVSTNRNIILAKALAIKNTSSVTKNYRFVYEGPTSTYDISQGIIRKLPIEGQLTPGEVREIVTINNGYSPTLIDQTPKQSSLDVFSICTIEHCTPTPLIDVCLDANGTVTASLDAGIHFGISFAPSDGSLSVSAGVGLNVGLTKGEAAIEFSGDGIALQGALGPNVLHVNCGVTVIEAPKSGPVSPITSSTTFFRIHSPVEPLVKTSTGEMLGIDFGSGSFVNDIHGGKYSGSASEPQVLLVPTEEALGSEIMLRGIAVGDYSIARELEWFGLQFKDSVSGQIEIGAIDSVRFLPRPNIESIEENERGIVIRVSNDDSNDVAFYRIDEGSGETTPISPEFKSHGEYEDTDVSSLKSYSYFCALVSGSRMGLPTEVARVTTGSGFASINVNILTEGTFVIEGLPVHVESADGLMERDALAGADGNVIYQQIPNGRYYLNIVTPLGFQADQEVKEVVVINENVNVQFNLTKVDITPRQRSRAYWASQLSKAQCGKPQDYTKAQFSKFAGLIAQHFNGNAINPVENYIVSQPATQDDSLIMLKKLLSFQFVEANEPFLKRISRGELLALMLNVVSGKVCQTQVVTKDGMTLSQAITYCDLLVNDIPVAIGEVPETYMPDCHRSEELKRYIKASFIAGLINVGVTLPAGTIPNDVVNIAYKYASEKPPVPTDFALSQNYPNPFNPVTNFAFALPSATDVRLEIYNTLGQRVVTLVDGRMDAGSHVVSWDASAHASGVYLYRLTAGDFVETKKMVLLK